MISFSLSAHTGRSAIPCALAVGKVTLHRLQADLAVDAIVEVCCGVEASEKGQNASTRSECPAGGNRKYV